MTFKRTGMRGHECSPSYLEKPNQEDPSSSEGQSVSHYLIWNFMIIIWTKILEAYEILYYLEMTLFGRFLHLILSFRTRKVTKATDIILKDREAHVPPSSLYYVWVL